MFHLGTTELIILLVIILLLFGVGRISKIAGELGKGVTAFRSGMNNKDEED
jgi:sec-independent protein translocase protein TatA